MQSGFDSWNTLQPVTCLAVPCNFGDPVRVTASPHVPVDSCMYNEGRQEKASAMRRVRSKIHWRDYIAVLALGMSVS